MSATNNSRRLDPPCVGGEADGQRVRTPPIYKYRFEVIVDPGPLPLDFGWEDAPETWLKTELFQVEDVEIVFHGPHGSSESHTVRFHRHIHTSRKKAARMLVDGYRQPVDKEP